VRVDVYTVTQEVVAFITSSDEEAPTSPAPEVVRVTRENKPVAVLQERRVGRHWAVAVPVHLDGVLAGVVHLQVSLVEADQLAARERRQAALIMGTSTVAIVLMMSVFLRQTLHRRLQNLVTTMARAEARDLAVEARVHLEDERGRLAASFNLMLQRIRNFNAELQGKIEQATAELRDLIGKLFEAQQETGRFERLAALGEVAALVAHEVGTPLTSVFGHLQARWRHLRGPISLLGDRGALPRGPAIDAVCQAKPSPASGGVPGVCAGAPSHGAGLERVHQPHRQPSPAGHASAPVSPLGKHPARQALPAETALVHPQFPVALATGRSA
jgi:signal transduction histidine kinase